MQRKGQSTSGLLPYLERRSSTGVVLAISAGYPQLLITLFMFKRIFKSTTTLRLNRSPKPAAKCAQTPLRTAGELENWIFYPNKKPNDFERTLEEEGTKVACKTDCERPPKPTEYNESNRESARSAWRVSGSGWCLCTELSKLSCKLSRRSPVFRRVANNKPVFFVF